MLIPLIRRELLDNLMTFRFVAAVFIMLTLVVAATFVLINDYDQRLASYDTSVKTHHQEVHDTKTYSLGIRKLQVDRPPNPMSIFNAGLDKRIGNEILVSHEFVPSLWDAEMHGLHNSFLNIFSAIDIVFIFEIVLSLLALIFAYDALVGEIEAGTLRLILTHPVRRGTILLAKYVSAMLCLLVPLLVSLIFALILMVTSASISLKSDDFVRVAGIVWASIAYLSIFYLMGMLISAITRSTSTTLIMCMFVWVFWVLVYPNMILATINPIAPPKTRTSAVYHQIKQIWGEFERERKRFLETDTAPGEDPMFNMDGPAGGGGGDGFSGDRSTLAYYYWSVIYFNKLYDRYLPQIPVVQNYYGFLVPRVINTADRTWITRKSALHDIFVRPAVVDRNWLKLSPIGIYDSATQAWAGTGLKGNQDFFEAVRQYRNTVIGYLYDRKTFESPQWFTAHEEAADWSTLPQFTFQRSDIRINAKRAMPDQFLLLIINVVLFIIIFLIFLKREVT